MNELKLKLGEQFFHTDLPSIGFTVAKEIDSGYFLCCFDKEAPDIVFIHKYSEYDSFFDEWFTTSAEAFNKRMEKLLKEAEEIRLEHFPDESKSGVNKIDLWERGIALFRQYLNKKRSN